MYKAQTLIFFFSILYNFFQNYKEYIEYIEYIFIIKQILSRFFFYNVPKFNIRVYVF
jgi:hypothetical protein